MCTVTDENGHFELSDVPPGDYTLVAWHEGWKVTKQESTFDVLTTNKVSRPVFSEPQTWEKQVKVTEQSTTTVNFTIAGN